MDKVFLIGHRGVGKTSLVKAFAQNESDYELFDLDEQVCNEFKQNIAEYFVNKQEPLFRERELKTLTKICQTHEKFIVALGAGVRLKDFSFPQNSLILWVRRQTDETGRVFIDGRPALTQNEDPIKEWQEIYPSRQKLYAEVCNAQMQIPETLAADDNYLYEYLAGDLSAPANYYCTLKLKENDWVALSESFGLELRNDIISEINIHNFLKQIRKDRRLILAIRKVSDLTINFLQNLDRTKFPNLKIDWDVSLGAPEGFKVLLRPGDILSEHRDKAHELIKLKDRLGEHYIYKFSPEVEDLKFAITLQHELYRAFPNMAYLPRSKSLDLSWLRNCLAHKNAIHFFRFAEGSAKEQTLWFDLKHHKKATSSYGILGEQVEHSLTPEFHKAFFLEKKSLPLRISINQNQFSESILDDFKKMGIKYLAITSPYKHKIYNYIKPDLKVAQFESVNTCLITKNVIRACDTDFPGLKDFFSSNIDPSKKTLVWGGGSLLPMLKHLLPEAIFVAARTGELRSQNQSLNDFDSTLEVQMVWASGEQGMSPEFKNLLITKVIDLDYKDSSKAKAWAYKHKVAYVSGKDFFVKQALKQQEFWDKNDL